jgi:hypothetical protein
MTISPYQVNSILKAYSKQSKVKLQISGNEHLKNDKYMDVVSLFRLKTTKRFHLINFHTVSEILSSRRNNI